MAFQTKHSAEAVRLVFAMREANATYREITEATGISKSQISRYLNGDHIHKGLVVDKCNQCKFFNEATGDCMHSQSFLLASSRGGYLDAYTMRTIKNKEACQKVARFFEPVCERAE